MASLAIVTEYYTTPVHIGGEVVQVPMEPPLAEQTVDFSSGVAATQNPLNDQTMLIRIVTNASTSFLFTKDGSPAATTNQVLPTGQIEFKGVAPGQRYKISFIANPSF